MSIRNKSARGFLVAAVFAVVMFGFSPGVARSDSYTDYQVYPPSCLSYDGNPDLNCFGPDVLNTSGGQCTTYLGSCTLACSNQEAKDLKACNQQDATCIANAELNYQMCSNTCSLNASLGYCYSGP